MPPSGLGYRGPVAGGDSRASFGRFPHRAILPPSPLQANRNPQSAVIPQSGGMATRCGVAMRPGARRNMATQRRPPRRAGCGHATPGALQSAGEVRQCPAREGARDCQATSSLTGTFDGFAASAAAGMATRPGRPLPGRDLHPLERRTFHGTRGLLHPNDLEKRLNHYRLKAVESGASETRKGPLKWLSVRDACPWLSCRAKRSISLACRTTEMATAMRTLPFEPHADSPKSRTESSPPKDGGVKPGAQNLKCTFPHHPLDDPAVVFVRRPHSHDPWLGIEDHNDIGVVKHHLRSLSKKAIHLLLRKQSGWGHVLGPRSAYRLPKSCNYI